MSVAAPPPFFAREPMAVYQAKAQDYLSSHQLADFRKCPFLYRQKRLGLIVEEDRPAYLIGRAAHTLILEGRDRFDQEYAVGGPINPATGKVYGQNTQAFARWALAEGRPVLSEGQFQLVAEMAASVSAHALAAEMLSEGVPEAVARADYCGVPCQIRIDWYSRRRGIVDLKTCDELTWFEADARRYG